MTTIKFGKRDLKAENRWSESDCINIKRPCVIILGGTDSTNNRVGYGYYRAIEQMLGVSGVPDEKRPFDIYSVLYRDLKMAVADNERRAFLFQHGAPAAPLRRSWARYMSPEERIKWFNPSYCFDLYCKVLRPFLMKEKELCHVPVPQLAKSLRRINFIAHSHGGFVALKLQELFEKDLKKLKYSEQEKQYLFSQISLIMCAGAQIPYGYSKMNTVYFSSFQDTEFSFEQDSFDSLPAAFDKYKEDLKQKKQNILISLPNMNESLWLTSQFDRAIGFLKGKIPDHTFDYFFRGFSNKGMVKEGRMVSIVASLLLQANLSESLISERESGDTLTPRHTIPEKITMMAPYQYGERVVPAETKLSKTRINILPSRLSNKLKQKIVQQALPNGQKYPISFIADLNRSIREKAAAQIQKLPKEKRKEAAQQFHHFNPFYQTALKNSGR